MSVRKHLGSNQGFNAVLVQTNEGHFPNSNEMKETCRLFTPPLIPAESEFRRNSAESGRNPGIPDGILAESGRSPEFCRNDQIRGFREDSGRNPAGIRVLS